MRSIFRFLIGFSVLTLTLVLTSSLWLKDALPMSSEFLEKNFGIAFHSFPQQISLFSGLEWDRPSLTYTGDGSSVEFSADSLKVHHELRFFPPRLVVKQIQAKSVNLKTVNEGVKAEESSPSSFSWPSFLSFENIDVAVIEAHLLAPEGETKISGVRFYLQSRFKGREVQLNKLQLEVERLQASGLNLENLKANVNDGRLSLADMKLIEPIELQLSFNQAIISNSKFGGGQAKLILDKDFLLQNDISFKDITFADKQISNASLSGRAQMSEQAFELEQNLSLSNHSKVLIEAGSVSPGDLQIRLKLESHENPLLPAEQIRSVKTDAAAKIEISGENMNWPYRMDFSNAKISLTSTIDADLVPVRVLPIHVRIQTQLKDFFPQKASAQISGSRLSMNSHELRGFKSSWELQGQTVNAQIDGTALTTLARGPVRLGLQATLEGVEKLKAKLALEDVEALSLTAAVRDKKKDFQGDLLIELSTLSEVFQRVQGFSEFMMNKFLSLDTSFSLSHPEDSIRELRDFSLAKMSLQGRGSLSDKSVEAPPLDFQFHANRPVHQTDSFSVNGKLGADDMNLSGFNFKNLSGAFDVQKTGQRLRLSQLRLSSDGFSLEADGQLEGLTGQIESLLKVSGPTERRLTQKLKMQGTLEIPLTLAITNGRNFDLEGLLHLKDLTLSSDLWALEKANGQVPIQESFRINNNTVSFRFMNIRNPFERVDYDSLQPLLADAKKLTVRKLRFHDRQYGPLSGFFEVQQNLISINKFNLALGRGRADGEAHINLNPAEYSFSTLARVQRIRLSETVPSRWSRRALSDDPLSSRIAILGNIKKSTLEGHIDLTQMSAGHIIGLFDILDPEHENPQFSLPRSIVGAGIAPERVSLKLRKGLLDLYAEIPSPIKRVRSIPVSGIIRSSFANLSKSLNKVPLK